MEWSKPLSILLVAIVAITTIGSAFELVRTTLADDGLAVASAASLALVAVAVVATVVVGARGRRWLENPDSYW